MGRPFERCLEMPCLDVLLRKNVRIVVRELERSQIWRTKQEEFPARLLMFAWALTNQSNGGFYCAAGGFHVDPWQPVDRAIVTHAHADHA